jgi:hypothetical protein
VAHPFPGENQVAAPLVLMPRKNCFAAGSEAEQGFRRVGDPVIDGGETRLWFTDDFFDLYVWINQEDQITEFQVCYDKEQRERVLTWKADGYLSHRQIDVGKQQRNMTPVYLPDGALDKTRIGERFRESSRTLEPKIVALVLEKIAAFEETSEKGQTFTLNKP